MFLLDIPSRTFDKMCRFTFTKGWVVQTITLSVNLALQERQIQRQGPLHFFIAS